MTKRGQKASPATAALQQLGITFETHSYDHDAAETNFGVEAAAKLGFTAERIFKTLVIDADGELVIGIVPVLEKLDLKALAAAVGAKRSKLADPALAERKTGYIVGGISPLGQRARLRTVLDASAAAHTTILVSGGRRGFDIELAPAELCRATGAISANIARV